MIAALSVLHVIVCIFLIAVVLLQRGKGAEMGAVFGGGASSTVFGSSGAGNFLTLLTKICAAVFMLTSGSLSYLYTQQAGEGLFEGGAIEASQQEPFEQLGTVDPEETILEVPQTDPAGTTGDDAVFAEPEDEDTGATDGEP
jgi:preprotein translocase subunit SecG